MAPGIVGDHLGRIKAHRLVVEQGAIELGREVGLQVKGLIGDQGKGSGVGLAKAKTGETRQLLPNLLRHSLIQAIGLGACHKALVQERHCLFRTAAAHGPAQPVRFSRGEPGHCHRDAQNLLLEDDHPQRLGQYRLQGRMDIVSRFQSLAAAQVRVYHAPLDGARADQSHADDNILKARGPELGQHLHLGAALYLKAANCIGPL